MLRSAIRCCVSRSRHIFICRAGQRTSFWKLYERLKSSSVLPGTDGSPVHELELYFGDAFLEDYDRLIPAMGIRIEHVTA
jgi:hypothetical protein